MFLCKSFKLSRLRNLSVFLGQTVHYALFNPVKASKYAGVIGWGHKATAARARLYAQKNQLPYLALEDGFLRSLDLGCKGAPPLSLALDRTGVYYNSGAPSDLENLLNENGWETEPLISSARQAIKTIIRNNLSKYNFAPAVPESLKREIPAKSVLLIDQTLDDASVLLGQADASSFRAMLSEAIENFPPDRIFVKIHPDVIAGKKKGYLAAEAVRLGVRVIGEDYAPLSLLACFDTICAVTSQMGFEGLLLNKEVRCYGMPFYAGWGATRDRLQCPRRKKRRTAEEIFAAACMLYPRYVNPFSCKACQITEVMDILAEQRRKNEQNRGYFACVGLPRWKRKYARAYLQSTGMKAEFFQNKKEAIAQAIKHGGKALAWAAQTSAALQKACDEANVPLVRMEDGFIRSTGLGSDFNLPYSLILDRKGIYFDPERPSELEDILNGLARRPDYAELMERAKNLQHIITRNGLTKYNINDSQIPSPQFPRDRKIALVPGQVDDDASVLHGGYGMTNLSLVQAARKAEPDAFIIYKPHPEVEKGNRKSGTLAKDVLAYADMILSNFPMGRLLEMVDEVHTLTSLTGFEALLRGKKVHTYGGPFYAGWGLTRDERHFARRKAKLSIEELIAGALILYPSYYDWETKSFCRVEDMCMRLLEARRRQKQRIWAPAARFARGILNFVKKKD